MADDIGNVLIVHGDGSRLPLADESVNLVITSPPYYGHRDYDANDTNQLGAESTPGQFIDRLIEYTAEWIRVLRRQGSLWVNLGDTYALYPGNRGNGQIQSNTSRQRYPTGHGLLGGGQTRNKSLMGVPWRYAIRCMDDLGLVLRAEVVWHKPNPMPESVRDRCHRAHETWFHLTRSDRYYATPDTMRLPSVWTVQTRRFRQPAGQVHHPATFPTEFPERIVTRWCPPGGTVLDPFGGSGTVAMVASQLGRTGICVDLSWDYCRLAAARYQQPPLLPLVP